MSVTEEMLREEEKLAKPKCKWIVARKVECRFPEEMQAYPMTESKLLVCICCLFGWHLEKEMTQEVEAKP